tara:strand:+ start:103 stop:261 length:159 start_codon:yes stop_codon:yes gene_type:complete
MNIRKWRKYLWIVCVFISVVHLKDYFRTEDLWDLGGGFIFAWMSLMYYKEWW